MSIEKNFEEVVKRSEDNARKIEENSNRISQNTGALEVLHTIKINTVMFFVMWLTTFVMFLLSVGYIIYVEHNTNTIVTETEIEQDVEQGNENGDNNFIGRDGDISG